MVVISQSIFAATFNHLGHITLPTSKPLVYGSLQAHSLGELELESN